MGNANTATGGRSVALGYQNNVTSDYSLAMGNGVNVSGFTSGAVGYFLNNDESNSFLVGKFNDNTADTNGLFMVGNGGNGTSRSNAFMVLSNGKILAPSLDLAEITDSKSLITKEYLEGNYIGVGSPNAPSGLEAIDEGNGIGWSLIGRNPDYYGNIGKNAVDFSSYYLSSPSTTRGATGSRSTAMGVNTTASGNSSTALGINTEASGNSSTALGNYTRATAQNSTSIGYDTTASGLTSLAMGNQTTASGENSTAMGRSTIASGWGSTALGIQTLASDFYSTALGFATQASGENSTVMGYNTIADDNYSTVIGKFNDNTTSTTTLFQIGNGINSSNRGNALTVLQNGFTAVGTHNIEPNADFQVNHGTTNINGFKLQNSGSNSNWWRFYTVNSTGLLYLYSKAGGDSSPVGSFNDDSGAYSALSDRRVKDNFKELHFNWQDFMQLKPLTYYYKTDKNKQSNIGLVAQDVQPIYPELVSYNTEADLYQLNYSGFGVVAIKAIQELKSEVNRLSEENRKLKGLLTNQEQASTEQSALLQALLDRVEALEKRSVTSDFKLVKN
jgi:hypothetical protein